MMGIGSIVVVAGAALLLFGPKKLPELGKVIGKTVREFKLGAEEPTEASPSVERTATSLKAPQDSSDQQGLPE